MAVRHARSVRGKNRVDGVVSLAGELLTCCETVGGQLVALRAVGALLFDAPLLPQLFHADAVDVFRRRVHAERHDVAGVVVHEESQLVDAARRREPR